MNRLYKNRYKIIFTLIAVFSIQTKNSFALDTSSLSIPSQIPDLQEQVDFTMEPKYPHPGDSVKITLGAYGTDLNNALITWTANGDIIKQGKGVKIINYTAGKNGQTTKIVAKITPQNGLPVEKVFYINPQSVDLLWEARTYTPPFYKGKAMFTPQERVIFAAIPSIIDANGKISDPNDVSYTWRQDGTVLGDDSGRGVQTLSYKGNILMKPVDIDVEASIENGDTAKNYLTLTPTFPEIGIYEKSPLYGILFNKEVSGGFDFGNAEERSVASFPYFFGVSYRSDPFLNYTWTINGSPINVPSDQENMTFRNTKDQEGKTIVGASIENTENFLEKATGGTVINFEKPKKVFSF